VCQRPAKLIRIELRIVPRARHGADIRQTFNAVGLEQRDEALDGESRMTDGEYRAVGPVWLLRRRMFHGGLGFTSIAP
jgi:hypothetical protein